MATSQAPARRRRGGFVRGLVVTVIALLALLVIADRVVAHVASSKIADQVRTKFGTTGEPDVEIAGFPLLTQVAAGSYERIQINAAGVDSPSLGEVDVRLDLRDLAIAASDVIAGDVTKARAGTADVEITIPEKSLSELTGLPITITGVTDDVARLQTTFEVFGQKVPVSVDAMVVVQGSNARLDVQGASAAGVTIPSVVVANMSDVLGVDFAVPMLVEGMHLDAVTARDGAVVLHASGRDVPFPSA